MRFLLTCICFTAMSVLYAQSDNVIGMALSSNNGKALSSFFDEKVDIQLPDLKDIYTKQQAKLVMSNFFNKNPIDKYVEKHTGGGNDKALFHIGFFQSGQKQFRTYILYNMVQDKPQIIELRIESED